MNERAYFIELWFLNLISCFKIYYLNSCCDCSASNTKDISIVNEIKSSVSIIEETTIEPTTEGSIYFALEDYRSPTIRYATLFKGQRVVVNKFLMRFYKDFNKFF